MCTNEDLFWSTVAV